MEMKKPEGPFCQSCGMPMGRPEDFGTEADGGKSKDYCHYCFEKGKFTEPEITMEQMTEKVSYFLVKMEGMPEAMAKEISRTFIPRLKRWQ